MYRKTNHKVPSTAACLSIETNPNPTNKRATPALVATPNMERKIGNGKFNWSKIYLLSKISDGPIITYAAQANSV